MPVAVDAESNLDLGLAGRAGGVARVADAICGAVLVVVDAGPGQLLDPRAVTGVGSHGRVGRHGAPVGSPPGVVDRDVAYAAGSVGTAPNPILYLGSYHGSSPLSTYLHTIGSVPLWFVLALLIFDGCYAACRYLTRDRQPCKSPPPLTYPMVIGFVVALALVTYAFRTVIPIGFWVPVTDFPSADYSRSTSASSS